MKLATLLAILLPALPADDPPASALTSAQPPPADTPSVPPDAPPADDGTTPADATAPDPAPETPPPTETPAEPPPAAESVTPGEAAAPEPAADAASATPSPDAEPPPAAQPEPAPEPAPPTAPEPDLLFDAAKALFEAYAPEEVKAEYEFPSREEWDATAILLQAALETGDMSELAALEPQARAAVAALRTMPEYQVYADWLNGWLDELIVAREVVPPPTPPGGAQPPARTPGELHAVWLQRLKDRPPPSRAEALLPRLKEAFAAEGLPTALVWLAEVESSFNPEARSPAGARGLFQFMPATARELGLSTLWPDERTHPEKSARAAARLLRRLHRRFGDWPLALAAYNAGEGRVSRTLKARDGKTFDDIAEALPAETRLYVPRVLATVALREGVEVEKLPPPASP